MGPVAAVTRRALGVAVATEDGVTCPRSVIRRAPSSPVTRSCQRLLAPLLLALGLSSLASPALAQQPTPPPAAAAPNLPPLTGSAFNDLLLAASITTCIQAKNKTPYDLAIQAGSQGIVEVVALHGRKIEGLPALPEADKFFGFVAGQIAVRTYSFCKADIPAKSLAEVERIMGQMKTQGKPQ